MTDEYKTMSDKAVLLPRPGVKVARAQPVAEQPAAYELPDPYAPYRELIAAAAPNAELADPGQCAGPGYEAYRLKMMSDAATSMEELDYSYDQWRNQQLEIMNQHVRRAKGNK